MKSTIIMFVAASLILVAGIVTVATPHTVQAEKVWCFKVSAASALECSGIGATPVFEKKTDCKDFTTGLKLVIDCKKIDPTKPTK